MLQKVHTGKYLYEYKVGKGFLGKVYKVQTLKAEILHQM